MPGPAVLSVVGKHQLEQPEGGRIDLAREFGDVVLEALQVAEILRAGQGLERPDSGRLRHGFPRF